MGNNKSASLQLQVVGNSKESDIWRVTESTGYCDVITNLETGEIGEIYTVPLDGRIKLEEEFQKYQYRRTQNQNLVRTYKVFKRIPSMDFLNVKIERIPLRLTEVRPLTLPEAIYALTASLVGYRRLCELLGPVKIDGNMIGITPSGEIKVWLNQNLAKNHPEPENEFEPDIPDQVREAQMVQQIVQAVRIQTQGQQFPPEIMQRLSPDKIRTFNVALHLVKEISTSLGLNIPKMRINLTSTTQSQLSPSQIQNRQSMPPMPPMSPIPSAQISNLQTAQFAQQSQLLQPNQVSQIINQGQSILQSQIQQSLIQQSVGQQPILPSQIQPNQQIPVGPSQLQRKSSSSSLRGSAVDPLSVLADQFQIIISSAPDVPLTLMSPAEHIALNQNQPILAYQNTTQNTYRQPGIPPINPGIPPSRGKPPRPLVPAAIVGQNIPEIQPAQIVQVVKQLRSGSKQLRRSLSKESNQTANFGPQQTQSIPSFQPKPSFQPTQPQNSIGIRSPSPLRNLSNSRVLIAPRITGPPVSAAQINSTQVVQENFQVIRNVPPQVVMERTPINIPERIERVERTTERVQRVPMFNQSFGQERQQRVVVKRSVEKYAQTPNPMTVVNTNNSTGSQVVHLLRHHNSRTELNSSNQVVETVEHTVKKQVQYNNSNPPMIPKPTTSDQNKSRGIGVFNQKQNNFL